MKQLAMALSAATLMIAANPASATVFPISGTKAAPTLISQSLAPTAGGNGTFASGSFDITSSNPKNATRFFNITYDFVAPVAGSGLFTFTTSSTGSALLKILGFSVNGVDNALMTKSEVVDGRTTVTYTGTAPISLAGQQSQTFSLFGSVLRTGSLTTNVSFAAAVPETATWLMMFAGIGMIGGALRVRRRQVRFQTA